MRWKEPLVLATSQLPEALGQKWDFVLEENRTYPALVDGQFTLNVRFPNRWDRNSLHMILKKWRQSGDKNFGESDSKLAEGLKGPQSQSVSRGGAAR
jgi:hypothetical protein